jgi:glycosyltransferase involved in cell wall biosynthesis
VKRSVIAVAHALPADVRNHLKALAEHELLRNAYTGYSYHPQRWMERFARAVDSICGTKLTANLLKRPEIMSVSSGAVKDYWVEEGICSMLSRRMGRRHWTSRFVDRIQTRLSKIASGDLRAADRLVIAREYEAKELFEQATRRRLCCVYHLPTAHYAAVDRILRREFELFPDRELQEAHERSVAIHRVARKDAELTLSTKVLVPSVFVKQTLLEAGVCENKIHVLPFGCETEWIADDLAKDPNLFLHVGQLSLRKGTHRLLRAWKRLGAHRTCELRLIGSMRLPARLLADFHGIYNYLGTMPRPSLRKHYAAASCFVLPALAEGFAVVIPESLSCGTPVVASRNSGAEGFIVEGEHGLLHDAQNDDQLCESLESLLSNRKRCGEMSGSCLQKARTWTWEKYRATFIAFIVDLLDGGEPSLDRNQLELVAS